MNRRIFCTSFLLTLFISAFSQNSCGVVASMSPSVDSIIHENTIVTFTSTSTNATSYQFIMNGSAFQPSTPINYVFDIGLTEVKLVASNGICSDTAVCYYFYPGTQPVTRDNIQIYYGLPAVNHQANGIIPLKETGYLLSGRTSINPSINYPDRGFLIKVKESGCVDWAKRVEGTFATDILATKQMSDSGFLIAGHQGSPNPFILRLNSQGAIQWAKRYSSGGLGNFYPYALEETSDGGFVSCGTNYGMPWVSILKFDLAGNVMWSRALDRYITSPQIRSIKQIDNYLYCGGYINYTENNQYKIASVIIKLDNATGQVIWTKKFTGPNGDFAIIGMEASNSQLVVNTNAGASAASRNLNSFFILDANGIILKSTQLHYTNVGMSLNYSTIMPHGNGDYYILSTGTESLALQPGFAYHSLFIKLDASNNVNWVKEYGAVQLGRYIYAALGPNKTFTALGQDEYAHGIQYWVGDSRKLIVRKMDSLGGEPTWICNMVQDAVTANPISITAEDFSWVNDSALPYTAGSAPVTFTNFYSDVRFGCPEFVDSCSYLRLTGPKDICNLNDQYTFKTHRNKACMEPVIWDTSSLYTIISKSDTSLVVKFNSFGIAKIAASLPFTCVPIKDSLLINVRSRSQPLSLGADTSICPANSLKLHAGPDYYSYLWQDGSTDSTFLVNTAGTYWVQVSDSCGNLLRDTIVVSSNNITVNAGPDLIKCNADSVTITAPTGFITYQWQPSYNINSVTGQSVKVFPFVDTSYILKAEKSPGCFAVDTIHVTVFHSPIIDLGRDTSFCNGDSIILHAGPAFMGYLWNTGLSTENITAYTKGRYTVIGTDLHACKSYDTLSILNVYFNPVVNLNHDTTICTNASRVLDAGTGYVRYLWNNGSVARTFTVNSTGLYSVQVWDAHSCRGGDTVQVKSILPAPYGFLSSDTAICSYGKIELIPTNHYSSYLWNTNANTFSIVVTKPGTYWLQVKDNHDCTGGDTIIVKEKQCMAGFYVPSAFTPGKSGHNQLFRPLLFGNVVKYRFIVYNRWGQIVFNSTELGKGWDGLVSGREQNSDTFVWTCIYQFEGEIERVEKGTVVLIR